MKKLNTRPWGLYLLLLLFCFTPLVWFYGRPGILINGSDTNFPLDPMVWFLRRLYVWNGVANAGTNFASSVAGLFFHAVQVVGFLITRNLQATQIISLVFWFAAITFSAWFFVKSVIPKNRLAHLVFICLYVFNTYLFNTWENVKVANLALMVALPFVLGLWWVAYHKTMAVNKTILYSALVGILMSGSGINPAYFATVFLGLVVLIIIKSVTEISRKNFKQVIISTAIVVLPLVGVNLFWVLPTIGNLFFSDVAIRNLTDIGYTNWLDSLSQNTTFFNVLRMQGAWDWYAFNDAGAPLYIPYVYNYIKTFPFIAFSIFIPTLAFFSLIFRSKNQLSAHLYPFFGSLLVLSVFLGVGSHAPTGVIYIFLVRHLPFFSFFRSPWYIFTPLLVVSQAGLVALLVFSMRQAIGRLVTTVLVAVVVVGNLVYCYPLVTGKIFRPAFPDNFYIKFPPYLFEAQKWLESTGPFRVIGYPDDEIERFTWGYNGIESILNLFSSKETLFASLSNTNSSISSLIGRFYESLRKGEMEKVNNLASKLNLGMVLVKNDQVSLAPDIKETLKDLNPTSFGPWTFYSLVPEGLQSKFYPADRVWLGQKASGGADEISLLGRNNIILSSMDNMVKGIPNITARSGEIVLAENSLDKNYKEFINSPAGIRNRISHRDLSKVDFTFNLLTGGQYYPVLERYSLNYFGLDTDNELSASLDGQAIKLLVDKKDSSFIYFRSFEVAAGEHTLSLVLPMDNLVQAGDFEETVGLPKPTKTEAIIKTENGNRYLSFYNWDESKVTVDFTPKYFDFNTPYLLELRYKSIFGDIASLSLEQGNSQTLIKAQAEGMPYLPEWGFYSVYFEPIKTPSHLNIRLLASAREDSLGTKILYDDLAFYKVFTNKLFWVKEAPLFEKELPEVVYKRVSPVKYEVNVTKATGSHILIFSENYSKDWKIKLFSNLEEELVFNPPHFSANLYANGWYMDGTPTKYKAVVYYEPQKYLIVGFVLSATVLVLSCFIYFKRR